MRGSSQGQGTRKMGWMQALCWRHRLIPWTLVMFIMLGIITNFQFQESANAAAWAQAWGTVLAVAAAIWISNDERRQAQHQKIENTLAVIGACAGFIQSIKTVVDMDIEKYPDLKTLEGNYELQHERRSHITKFWANSGHNYKIPAYAKALSEIPLHELNSPEAISALLELLIQFNDPKLFTKLIDKYVEHPENTALHQEAKASLENYSQDEKRKTLLGVVTGLSSVSRQNLQGKLTYLQKQVDIIRYELAA